MRRFMGALVRIAASWFVIRAARLATRIMARNSPRVEDPLGPDDTRNYSIDAPGGLFMHGSPYRNSAAMVLPKDGAWAWRVACGDMRMGGVEPTREVAKQRALEAYVAFERMGVQ